MTSGFWTKIWYSSCNFFIFSSDCFSPCNANNCSSYLIFSNSSIFVFNPSTAFTLSFATKKTEKISDYFGVVSGNVEDKIAKSGVHVTKSNFVDAPIIEEYPLTLECTVESFEDGNLIGNVVNVSIDEDYLDENGKIDVDKMEIIAFDMINNTYRVLGENVGKAFKDGFDL